MQQFVLGLLFAAAFMVNGVVHAHGLWFAQRSGELALVYGEGGDDLDMVKRLSLVNSLTGYDSAGKTVRTGVKADGRLALVNVQARPVVVAAVLDNGIWTKSADGRWHKKRRDEVPDAISSSHNLKYAVHLLEPLDQKPPILPEHALQIVPVTRVPANMGQSLRVQVLYRGKPAVGVEIIPDLVNDPDGKPFFTGQDGMSTIPVRNQGLNVIAAKLIEPSADTAATGHVEHLATLSFRLAHAPE
ncbi:Uncharacterized conserved protein, contains GH25 family domain [Formivibrio citricus]|uniref:Uncharacterized conserved protein, contains GH25 family domain n=1 Tax=Formivibrio citricus TaxID=83765 RepID=A0A1I5CKP0_9NEIS|nr:DUF4198 domain-containing protein [Formivibrio citricus]SFN87467.1 Uncharacterized conserved protein, contains GH25 family domain [Formivibrio citricus]